MKPGRKAAVKAAAEGNVAKRRKPSKATSKAAVTYLRDAGRNSALTAFVAEARYDVATDEELIEKHREGGEGAGEALLSRYRNLARMKAHNYFLAGADRDDIVQESMIGLYKAIRDFNADRKTSFRVFADVCITRQLISAIRSARCQKHVPLNSYVSISKMSSDDDEDRSPIETLIGPGILDPAEVVIADEDLGHTRAALDQLLSAFEVNVLRLFTDGKSYHEIAEILGREVKSIDNALQRIKRKIGVYLETRSAETDAPPLVQRPAPVHPATLPLRRVATA